MSAPTAEQMKLYDERLKQIARENIERHLGDVFEEGSPAEFVRESAYTLGVDALVDAGFNQEEAAAIATAITNEMGFGGDDE